MKCFTPLCLIIFVTQISGAVHKKRVSSVSEFRLVDIDAWDVEIPENSWFEGILPDLYGVERNSWPFDWIEYKRDILQDSEIRLDYSVQYLEEGFLWRLYWENLYHDSVLLCDTTNSTQDATIIALIRELLGIPEGCPVSAGERRRTRGIHFPLTNKHLLLNADVRGKNIRILTNMWDDERHKLFTGNFNIVYPTRIHIRHHYNRTTDDN